MIKCCVKLLKIGHGMRKYPWLCNSLKACHGAMFFLPLPFEKTVQTLEEVGSSSSNVGLPPPELYIIVNGKPSKQKVMWRSLVDINAIKAAIQKLKEVNWLYKAVDEYSFDEVEKKVIEVVDSTTSSMLVKATREDISGYTIRTLNEKLSTSSDIEQFRLMNVTEKPLDNRQKYLDVMCFPVLYPSGRFGEHHDRAVRISSSEYVKSRLLSSDSRFRKDPQFVFYNLWQKEMRELAAGVYNLMKGIHQQRMPVQVFLNKVSSSDQELETSLSTVFQSVRGSKQYWFLRSSELNCMVWEFGAPTLFMTFSCAEYENPEIANYLHKVNDVPENYPIGKLCCEDPVSVSRKFSPKFHSFFNTVIVKGQVLGHVSHHFIKEYQARGAPHFHMVLWIQDAPTIGNDHPEQIANWVEERITCRIPDQERNPELHKLVTKYQMHKCSSYCKRRKKFGSAFVTRCKFDFLRPVSESFTVNDVEDSLKSKRKIYQLARAEQDTRVNDYNPLLLMLWKANMDIQKNH